MTTHRSRRARFVGSAMLAAVLVAPASGVPAMAKVSDVVAVQPAAAPAALSSGQLTVVKVTGSLSSPLGVTHAGDGSGRLFVLEQGGRVRIVKGGRITGTFLDLTSRTDGGGERGLLGLAFHPDFPTNGYVYAYYTMASGGDIRISRYTANAARTFASLMTEHFIITIEHSAHSNHNGGGLAFGPDGYLYAAVGDGGGSNDPDNNGQNKNTHLGKILRIDINGTGSGIHGHYAIPADNPFVGVDGADAVWDWGLRNPWRISFDRATGDLYIGDVGQGAWEEVDLEDVNDPGGNNYGWDVMEGAHCRVAGCTPPTNDVLPVAEYSHSFGCSITGGYVYRGAHRDLQGLYVYGDYCSGRIWTMNASGSGESVRRDTSLNISSFGENEAGELYLTDLNGSLYRVIAPEFSDIASSTFIDDIHWLFYEGITGGCGGGRFCPRSAVTRVQMAQFLVRAFNYPTTATDYFTDDNGIVGESSINALAQAGITGGCAPNLFCPTRPVTRAQMAIFLVNAITPPLPPSPIDYFDDDDGKTGESSINSLAHAGLTGGCGPRKYCPTSNVTREQMAAFLHRALT